MRAASTPVAVLLHMIPVGVNVNSPVTWLLVVVAAIVLALTLSTRRSTLRPRQPAAARGAPQRYAGDWSAAQAMFLDDPRAGCVQARAIVAKVRHERGAAPGSADGAEPYVAAAEAVLERADASTDDLRAAFTSFRLAFESLF